MASVSDPWRGAKIEYFGSPGSSEPPVGRAQGIGGNNPPPVQPVPPTDDLKDRVTEGAMSVLAICGKVALLGVAAVGAVGFGLAAIGVVTMTMGLGIIPLACVGFTVVVLGGFLLVVPKD